MKTQKHITESPIEDHLLEILLTNINPAHHVETQQEFRGRSRRLYRVDVCIFTVKGRSVVIECDGRDFHDFREDRERDIDLLDSGRVDDIARFRGADINFNPTVCIDRLRNFLPFLFDLKAEPLDGERFMLQSAVLGPEQGAMPIFRSRVPRWLTGQKKLPPTFHPIRLTRDNLNLIVEAKSPMWGRIYHGPTAQPLGHSLLKGMESV